MSTIKNPNEIVDEFVSDFQGVFNDSLISVAMYGSAVTHEYRPGWSDINIVVVLKDDSISLIEQCVKVAKKWNRRRVAIPFFMTKQFIASALDSYPIEFLDIQSNYRVLFGEDVFAHLDFKREFLRLQCERELRGIGIHLRKEYVRSCGNATMLNILLTTSMKKLLPILKAFIKLNNKPVPKIKGDIVMAVEDLCNAGASALSEALHTNKKEKGKTIGELFDRYAKAVDMLVDRIDAQGLERESL